jgi:transposase-like protein
MSRTTELSSSPRQRWSSGEKARLVRRHLQEGISLADLAEESGASPGQISRWCKEALEGLESVFAQAQRGEQRASARVIEARERRIRALQEVVTELSKEVLRLKKGNGAR